MSVSDLSRSPDAFIVACLGLPTSIQANDKIALRLGEILFLKMSVNVLRSKHHSANPSDVTASAAHPMRFQVWNIFFNFFLDKPVSHFGPSCIPFLGHSVFYFWIALYPLFWITVYSLFWITLYFFFFWLTLYLIFWPSCISFLVHSVSLFRSPCI
jgi:hypothetical protein